MKNQHQLPSAWIKTGTGRYHDLLCPESAEISIDDIAIALSKINRFGGHPTRVYSVAEHCLLGADLSMPNYALEFLLHDATEAYLGDIVGPLKSTAMFDAYRGLEARWWNVIAFRFGVREKLPREVHVTDRRMLATELRDLMGHQPRSTDAYAPFPTHLPHTAPSAAQLQEKFLAKFYELVGMTVGAKR